jgi:hypothetical protein
VQINTKKQMAYSVKSVKFFDTPDGGGFNCTLFQDGKKVAYVHDSGMGGSLHYDCVNGWKFGTYEFDQVVYDLVHEYRRKKDDNKGIIVKKDWGYDIIRYGYIIPTIIKKYNDGLALIQKAYDEAKNNGEQVLNTEYLESIGVSL